MEKTVAVNATAHKSARKANASAVAQHDEITLLECRDQRHTAHNGNPDGDAGCASATEWLRGRCRLADTGRICDMKVLVAAAKAGLG
jgi:hypothetical protein